MNDRETEIGALWTRVSKNGARYMTGNINGVEVVLFEVKNKRDKQPDWRCYKSEPRPARQAAEDDGF